MDSFIDNQKKNFSNFIKNLNLRDVEELTNLIYNYKEKNIFLLGVGKSNNVANHFSDILKSIGINAINLNLLNITHGDFGLIKEDDLVIFFSKSGNTKEILNIVSIFSSKTILICCSNDSKIKNLVDKTFVVPLEEEGDLFFKLIPSNSIVNTIIYCNYIFNNLISKLNLTLDDYKKNHPSGDIGFKSKKLIDFVNKNIFTTSNINLTIKETIEILKKNKLGIIFLNNNKFIGISTTKDILKYLSEGASMNDNINKYINRNPVILENSQSFISLSMTKIKKYKFFKLLPIIDNGNFVGILDNSKILKFL